MAVFGKAWATDTAHRVIGRREIMQSGTNHLHQQHVLDGAHRPTAALKTQGDGPGQVLEADHADRTSSSLRVGWPSRRKMVCLNGTEWVSQLITAFCIQQTQRARLPDADHAGEDAYGGGHTPASTLLFVCTEHSPEIVDGYFEALDGAYLPSSRIREDGRDALSLLKGPVCHGSFQAAQTDTSAKRAIVQNATFKIVVDVSLAWVPRLTRSREQASTSIPTSIRMQADRCCAVAADADCVNSLVPS